MLEVRIWSRRLVLFLALLSSCSRKDTAQRTAPPASASASASGSAASSPSSVMHDPTHPPIDCPLHKHGIDPTQLRPFEDVAKYIEFLERPDRAEWQKPDAVVSALGLTGAEQVLDLGAGSGYFSFRFAKAVPRGKIIAADTEAEMVRHIHHRALTEGVSNLQAKLILPSDPGVDNTIDLVFLCDVLHHVSDRPTWLGRLAASMRSGARLAVIEFRQGKLPQGPPEGMKIPRAEIVALMTRTGLTLEKEHEGLLPYQVLLVFKKP